VTGAAGGMGTALCRLLDARGFDLVAIDHNHDRLKSLGIMLGDRHRLLEVSVEQPDLSARVEACLTSDPLGLVNLAGVSLGSVVNDLDEADWRRSFSINVDAPMRLARLCMPRMRQKGGSIVNVCSPVAFVGARKPAYAASKAALHGLTMSLARDGGPDGIRVNTLLPGATITNLTADWDAAKRQAIADRTFLRRLCTSEEIAEVIAFLLSPAASYLTGSIIDLTAGSIHGH